MPSITRIPTTSDTVLAFEINGEIQADALERMAQTMNDAFDRHDTTSLLVLFRPYDGSETGATLDWDVLKANFRSLSNLEKYAIVGGSEAPKGTVDFFDDLIPIDAETFDLREAEAAWDFVGASPRSTPGVEGGREVSPRGRA